ncbi:MAG: hypothetical protein K2W82_04710 [Candidatus Obscuribacterales bacterium]|nr:hypothetical protein [Candidatus Obscuribacterales bacterium]
MSYENSYLQFQEARLKQAVKHYNDKAELMRLLPMRLQKCMELLFKKIKAIAETVGGEVMSCKLNEETLTVKAYERILTFAPIKGAASDARLQEPRGLYCCQVLIFGHLDGQEESRLLSTFRVYPDGLCSAGDITWKIDDDSLEFTAYVTEIIADHLFGSDLFWPAPDEMPDFIRTIPLQHNKVQAQELKDICVGFECDLGSKFSSITGEINGQKHKF